MNTGEVVVRSIETGGPDRVHADRAYDQSRGADADRCAGRFDRGQRGDAQAVRGLLRVLKPLGPTPVKGVSEPVNVYEVTGLGPLRTRLPALGAARADQVRRARARDGGDEARALEQAHSGPRADRRGDGARPGAGKSRLFYEFKATLAAGWMVLEAFSVSHGKASAYLPVLDLLHGYFEIADDDDQRTRREKVRRAGSRPRPGTGGHAAVPVRLLGIVEGRRSAGADGRAGEEAAHARRDQADPVARTLNQPLMVIFEDLHWIDEETQALLNLLADSIGDARVLLLVNYRPEYSHEWGNKTYYTQLRLDPLGRESAEEMLSRAARRRRRTRSRSSG